MIGNKGESCHDIVHRLLMYCCKKRLDVELNEILENEEFMPLDLEAL